MQQQCCVSHVKYPYLVSLLTLHVKIDVQATKEDETRPQTLTKVEGGTLAHDPPEKRQKTEADEIEPDLKVVSMCPSTAITILLLSFIAESMAVPGSYHIDPSITVY